MFINIAGSGSAGLRVSPSIRCVPRPRCNPFGCQQMRRGVIRDKKITQGETRKESAGEKERKLTCRQTCASVVFHSAEALYLRSSEPLPQMSNSEKQKLPFNRQKP